MIANDTRREIKIFEEAEKINTTINNLKYNLYYGDIKKIETDSNLSDNNDYDDVDNKKDVNYFSDSNNYSSTFGDFSNNSDNKPIVFVKK